MLATSSSSSRSKFTLTDSTSLLANVDLDIVERIFERGKHATSFPQIFRPYTEVLQEHGISPTNDSTYYGFLLKVGVIKAPTWGDKWSIWKVTQKSSPIPDLATREDELHSSLQSSDRSFSKSQLPALRARVPFLASASSDIDEAFAASNHEDDDHHEGESLIQCGRPSPKKELSKRNRTQGHSRNGSRSLVGYTPEQSFNASNELTNFDPPVRTSTPIARSPQRHLDNFSRFDPPAYSVSDTSQALQETTEDFSALGLVTPKGKFTSRIIVQQSPTWVDRLEELSEDDRRYMEKKADDFYKFGLMGRCWDMWFETSEFYRITYNNIPVARDNLLLRQILEKWSKATRYQLSLPGTADHHRQLNLKLKVLRDWSIRLKEKRLGIIETAWTEERRLIEIKELFDRWRIGAQRRRTERWKIDMAERELKFVQKRNKRLMEDNLKIWRIKTRGRLAKSDNERRLILDMFYQWRYFSHKQKNLRSALATLEQQKLRDVFDFWRRKTLFQPRETIMRQRQESGLIKRVWDDWRISGWQAKQSSIFDKRRLLLMVMDKWKIARQRRKMMERKALIYDKTRLLDSSLRRWKLESWGRLLVRAKEKRLLGKTLTQWKDKQHHLLQMDVLADQFAERRQSLQLQKLFSRWRSLESTRQTDHLRAVLIHKHTLQVNVLSKWRNSTETIQKNKNLADKAHAFFLLRTAFKAWRAEDARRKAERWLEDRNKRQMKDIFTKWRSLSVKYKDLRRREDVLNTHYDKLILRRSVTRWTNRVIEVKDRELRVSRARDDHVMSDALQKWRARLSIIQQNQKKASDSLEIREAENLRRVFRFWRGRAKRQKRLRLTVETSLVARDNRLMRDVFERWYERKRERDLEDTEKEVAFLHENVILYGVMDKWKAGTEILPGITANAIRLKRKTMNKWLVALDRKRIADQLQRDRDSKLLSEAFALWRDAAAYKATLNARRSRGRSRPSNISDRRSSLGLNIASQRFPSTSGRRITPTNANFPSSSNTPSRIFNNNDGGKHSPSLGVRSIRDKDNDHDTVRSEPVYSRLRSELGIRGGVDRHEERRRRASRGASEEIDDRNWNNNLEREGEKPRSGSEMIRALKGNIPGR